MHEELVHLNKEMLGKNRNSTKQNLKSTPNEMKKIKVLSREQLVCFL